MKLWIAAAAILVFGGSLSAQAPTATVPDHAADEGVASIVVPGWLAGRWTAPPFEIPLSSDFHRSVYGPNARSVRRVTLTIRPSGDGTFTVNNSVRDRSGKTVPGTRQLFVPEERPARLMFASTRGKDAARSGKRSAPRSGRQPARPASSGGLKNCSLL